MGAKGSALLASWATRWTRRVEKHPPRGRTACETEEWHDEARDHADLDLRMAFPFAGGDRASTVGSPDGFPSRRMTQQQGGGE